MNTRLWVALGGIAVLFALVFYANWRREQAMLAADAARRASYAPSETPTRRATSR